MKKALLLLALIQFSLESTSQIYKYNASSKNPYGLLNPNAPKETGDFGPIIGECECKSISRIDQNTWADTVSMTWTFKYIMNGMAVQDETLKADGGHSGSIRQYNSDSSKWYVHYYSSSPASPSLGTWEGGKKGENIVLYKDSAAPNGTSGDYRLTFSNLSEKGFDWAGEWVDKSESFVYPTWKIYCKRKAD
jgi:hypothetical protein